MFALLLAVGTAVVGIVPLLLAKRFGPATALGILGALVLWLIYYLSIPSLGYPLLGASGVFTVLMWVICLVIEGVTAADSHRDEMHAAPIVLSVVGLLVVLGSSMVGCGAFRASDYSAMLGDAEQREWTADQQPKDPRHVRLVPKELAFYLATKQLGEITGALGSQFEVDSGLLTIQLINGELWYVAPLDFRGYTVWTSADYSPGYVMVHGEDPSRPVIVKTGHKFQYLKSAYFSDNIERLLWVRYPTKIFTDFSFEIDDEGKPWWVVTVFETTIGWSGYKVTGVQIVDPTTGKDAFYDAENIPHWVDRVVPQEIIRDYINWHGEYVNGWWNSWWGHEGCFEPETPEIAYGEGGEPLWVTCITSTNAADKSLIGIYYTNSRTGKSVFYHASGGTEEAVLELVNNKVKYKLLHGSGPVLYNIYGVMTSIVPLVGESHTYQGVAFVDVKNMQATVGGNPLSAFREYQKLLSTSAQQITPEEAHDLEIIDGVIARIMSEVRGGETVYYVYLASEPRIFTGGSELSPKLPLSQAGDRTKLRFIDSGEDVVPLMGFDNTSILLATTARQDEARSRGAERRTQVAQERETRDARGEVQNMSDEELRELVELRKKQKGKAQ